MRILLIGLFLLTWLGVAQSQERLLCWKYGLFSGGMHFAIPRAVTFTGAAFVRQKEERQLVRRVYNLRVLIASPEQTIRNKDLNRYFKRAKRRQLEEIITVRDGNTHVRILAKTRKEALRKVVVLVASPEDGLILFSLRGKLRIKDLNKVLQKVPLKKDVPVKKYLPDMA